YADTRVHQLTVDFITNIDSPPLLFWKADNAQGEFKQTAYQIVISKSENGDGKVWDSGKITSSQQMQIKAEGEFKPGEQYFAKVRVWDGSDEPSDWSEMQRFFIPLNYPQDWQSEWITYDYDPDSALPVFRKAFLTENINDIDFVRLYISAPGYYEAYLNGDKIGKNVLDPGQTNYEDYTYYTSYDIDPNDLKKKNVLGVMLGNGWYNQNMVWNENMAYGQPVFTCQLVYRLKNGKQKYIVSDESWKWKAGPLIFSNIYAGDYYDANREVEDWFNYDVSGTGWKLASPADKHPDELYEQFAEPIQVTDTLRAIKVIDNKDGKYIFDFGQNFAGWTRIRVNGTKGQEITIRYAEELDDNMEIDPSTTGVFATKVVQTSKYTCKGDDEPEIWEPKFAYHGFRYAEVDGLNKKPEPDLLTGVVVHSSLPSIGKFQCSEPNINKLHELSKWTMRSNIHSIPTDCPHREKCGWLGDVHPYAKALMYNYNAQRFFSKWMFDIRSSARNKKKELYFGRGFHDRSIVTKPKGIPTMIAPGKRTSGVATPDWGTVMIQLPWELYLYYGDSIILKNFYPDMKKWVEYIESKKENGLIPHGLGDWCPPGGNDNIDTPVSLSSTAFHILDVKIMKHASALFGYTEDNQYYSELLDQLIHDFNSRFLDTANYTYGSQTGNVLALDIGITPEKLKHKIAEATVRNMEEKYDGFINTGIFGLSRIFKVLAENGFEEEVYRLLTKTGKNSFAFMWEKYDATTLWEVLPLNDNYDSEVYNQRSHNHPMQGGYGAWFYSGIAGINPDTENPGFKNIIFKPYLTQYLDSAKASYNSGFGRIKSEWVRSENKLTWKIEIPENTTGQIYVPVYGKEVDIYVNGKEAAVKNKHNGFGLIGNYKSGEYLIEVID
ncbi:MAG: family 78 glycoside hydrolase catalytic domain, partial [Candidatus Cloacimonetes bacterium]|nr:family 78 glycoside hydrolase catalytic domain [Candidatus Cloacimonadota bacterium]